MYPIYISASHVYVDMPEHTVYICLVGMPDIDS